MKVLYTVSLLMLNVFAEEVYRQKRDEGKEKSIDAEETRGVGMNDNKQKTPNCVTVPVYQNYALGTVSCYRYGDSIGGQAAADNSYTIKESKLTARSPVRNVSLNPDYAKSGGDINYNDIALIQLTIPLSNGQTKLPPDNCKTWPGQAITVFTNPVLPSAVGLLIPFQTVEAKVALIKSCSSKLLTGRKIPNLFCVTMSGCRTDIYRGGLPAKRNGTLRGILMNSACSGDVTYLVYLEIRPYINWLISQMKIQKRLIVGSCK